MKRKLISLLLSACALLSVIAAVGCASSGGDNGYNNNSAEKQKAENVYRSDVYALPAGYTPRDSAVTVHGGRVYINCARVSEADEGVSESVIFSINTDDTDGAYESTELYEAANDGAYPDIMRIADNGERVFVEAVYSRNSSSNKWYIVKKDADGNVIFSVNINDSFSKDAVKSTMSGFPIELDIDDMKLDTKNNIHISSTWGLLVLDQNGEKLLDAAYGYEASLVLIGDRMALSYYDDSVQKALFKYIDTDMAELGESVSIPHIQNLAWRQLCDNIAAANNETNGDSGYLFYVNTPTALVGVSEIGVTDVIDWFNSDVNPLNIERITMLGENKFLYMRRESDYSTTLCTLTKVPDEEIVPKYVITAAVVGDTAQYPYVHLSLSENVVKFNQQSNKYRITVVDYYSMSDPDGSAVQLMNNDIAAGKIPDIVIFDRENFRDTTLPESYESKGMFVNLYDYMDNDRDFPRKRLAECAKSPFENDGKLYRLVPRVSISAFARRADCELDIENKSFEEYLELHGQNGVDVFPYMTQDILTGPFVNFFSCLIDEEAGVCHFDSESFISYLNFVKSLPDSNNQYNHGDDAKKYQNGTLITRYSDIASDTMMLIGKAEFGVENLSELKFFGLPRTDMLPRTESVPSTDDKNNAVVEDSLSYAISAKSEKEKRDGAWEFIKFMADKTDESPYKSFQSLGVSTVDTVFAAEAEIKFDTLYTVDGGSVSSSYGNSDPSENIDRWMKQPGIHLRITQEDCDILWEFMDSITHNSKIDYVAQSIITEESQLFLAGAKSAEETAKVIQNRISIYLSESH